MEDITYLVGLTARSRGVVFRVEEYIALVLYLHGAPKAATT